jgi:hypothetical protein
VESGRGGGRGALGESKKYCTSPNDKSIGLYSTGRVKVEDARLRLGAQRVSCPAEQSAEIQMVARCVAQNGGGSVLAGPLCRRQVQQLSGSVKRPAEARRGRFGLDMAFHFARESLGSAVGNFLARPAHRLVYNRTSFMIYYAPWRPAVRAHLSVDESMKYFTKSCPVNRLL